MKNLLKVMVVCLIIHVPFYSGSAELKEHILTITLPEVEISEFQNYKDVIGYRESKGNYRIVNRTSGCMGKYQFAKSTLKGLGFKVTKEIFLSDSIMQERAMDKLIVHNRKWARSHGLYKFIGKTVGGIYITEEGILAALHLLGGLSVKDYLYTNGSMEEYYKTLKDGRVVLVRKKDGLNTSVKEYLNLFNSHGKGKAKKIYC